MKRDLRWPDLPEKPKAPVGTRREAYIANALDEMVTAFGGPVTVANSYVYGDEAPRADLAARRRALDALIERDVRR